MSSLIPDIESSKKSKIYFKTFNDPMPHGIFKTKKNKKDGLFERKAKMENSSINAGRWTEDEHSIFMKACLQHGPKWTNVNFILLNL
jgi:hypothetical protein